MVLKCPMGYSRKNPRYTFLKTPPGIFKFVTFTLRNPKENKVSLLHLETLQNCVAPLANSKVKNQKTHGWKFHRQHMSFS